MRKGGTAPEGRRLLARGETPGNFGRHRRRRVGEALLEFRDDRAQVVIQPVQGLLANPGRHAAVIRLGNSSRDAGDRVAVAAERDRQADGALVVGRCLEWGDENTENPGDSRLAIFRLCRIIRKSVTFSAVPLSERANKSSPACAAKRRGRS